MPSFVLIRPTVWPQYTNVTDRQDRQTDRTDRQRTDSIGRTVLQTVAQKWLNRSICRLCCGLEWAEGSTSWIVFASRRQCAINEGTLAPPGEYDWTVRLRRRCGLTSNYFDHLLYKYSLKRYVRTTMATFNNQNSQKSIESDYHHIVTVLLSNSSSWILTLRLWDVADIVLEHSSRLWRFLQ